MTIDEKQYEDILNRFIPKYIGRVFTVEGCPVPLIGDDIKHHIKDCKKLLISAATLGSEFDKTLRQLQLEDMAGAFILDRLSGKRLHKFCCEKDCEVLELSSVVANSNAVGFSPRYGDFPLSVNREIVTVLDASKKIGICVLDSFMLTPQKSITRIVGIRSN